MARTARLERARSGRRWVWRRSFTFSTRDSGDLVAAARRVLRGQATDAVPELQRSTVETATGVHARLEDLRRDLLAQRREVADAAARSGLSGGNTRDGTRIGYRQEPCLS